AARNDLIKNLSLPGVNDEVKSLQKDIENTTMLNQSFTYGGFKESVGSGEYSIIHIASHGYFGKSADDSFVMTYDQLLKLGDFQSLLSSDKIKKNPIDLLTLSACQTAAGDDRALLGFSGMAIKTNALSAIGTLWSVDDVATAKFMDVFYANLTTLSKAQALRHAQLFLLTKDELKHPHYWSPFIMVGNW
ncbi:MAG: CHAT domain-containing protein, partial [Methylococcaceae bacterium]